MYIPSYDFRIFDLPLYSPLQAQEFGAATSFSANTPTSYIDYSINQLASLSNPSSPFPYIQRQFPYPVDNFDLENYFNSFQDTPLEARRRLEKLRDQANEILGQGQTSTDDCKQGRNILGGCGPILGSKKVHSDDSGVGDKKAPPGMNALQKTMNALGSLPEGAGLFLVAAAIIILLLLFVKR